MEEKIEIFEYDGEGYSPVMSFGEWRVAVLNYAERFDCDAAPRLERHTLTDEVFVLLRGEGTLYIGEGMKAYKMEKNKIYNVGKGTWHRVTVSRESKLLVVENRNTGPDNTEYLERGK